VKGVVGKEELTESHVTALAIGRDLREQPDGRS